MEPLTFTAIASAALSGYTGHSFNAIADKGVSAIPGIIKRMRQSGKLPPNHDLYKALRISMLDATHYLLGIADGLVEINEINKTQTELDNWKLFKEFSDDWISREKKIIDKYLAPDKDNSPAYAEIEILLTRDKDQEIENLRKELAKRVKLEWLKEWQMGAAMDIPGIAEELLMQGWFEEEKAMDWFSIATLLFAECLKDKKHEKAKDAFQNRLLSEIKTETGVVIDKLEDLAEIFSETMDHYDFIRSRMSRQGILLEEIKETTDQALQIVKEILDQTNKKEGAPGNIELITPALFEKELIVNEKILNQVTIDYYLKFNNNWNNIKKVIANKIHIEPDDLFHVKADGEFIKLSLQQIIDKAAIGQPLLLKIMAVGGVGKSTLLWHFINKLAADHKTFFLKRADPDCIQYIFKEPIVIPGEPVLLFLDDVVSFDENRENLVQFAEAIAEHASKSPIILFASERFYRYDKFKSKKEFERNFTAELTLAYSNDSIRRNVFDKIFNSLNINSEVVSPGLKSHCYKIFNQHKFDSLIDSAFNLIVYLKKDFPDINYRFDWEDWKDACVGRYEPLNDLFKIVAFFYQFGIPVPLDYLKDYFHNIRGINDLLRELLGSFRERYSPIVLAVMYNGKQGLFLRHEKMGEWFFEIIPGGEESAREYFTDFLDNVRSRASSYLFRNIIRKNTEFTLSPYRAMISYTKNLQIANQYLAQVDENSYEEEEFKMLMEKHFLLRNLGHTEESIEPIETILKHKADNIYAMTRLAFCIQETDAARAETLLKEVIKLETTNRFAAFGLFRLYYDNPVLKQFETYQDEIFSKANSNLYFANKVLQIVEIFFNKLRTSTINKLLELFSAQNTLGIDIVGLLILKKAYNRAQDILSKLENNISNLSFKNRNRMVQQHIRLYQLQNTDEDKNLKAAERIIKINFQEDENNPDINILYAKLLIIKNQKANYKKAEKYFSNAFGMDKSHRTFFTVIRFYRDYAAFNVDKKKNNSPKVVALLLKGINLLQSRLNTFLVNRLNYELELSVFYNEIIQAYFHHAKYIKDPSNKYPELINKIENKCESILEKCRTGLKLKLVQLNNELFSNYLVDEDDVKLFARVCSISYDFFTNKAKRLQIVEKQAESDMVIEYFVKAKTVVEQSLLYNEDNPSLIINLIDIKIAIKDTDIAAIVEKIDFGKFLIKQKARLCRLLIKRGHKAIGVKLFQKFGQLNSPDIWIKNDLAFCYIETMAWGNATSVLIDVENPNEDTLDLIKRIALEMPATTEERANAKIQFSEMHLARKRENTRQLKQNICETLFIASNRAESYIYFCKNRFNVDFASKDEKDAKAAFEQLAEKWYPGLVNFLVKGVAILETIVLQQGRYAVGLDQISRYMSNLLETKINFAEINYNRENNDEYHGKIKLIIRKSVNMLYKMLESKTVFSKEAFNLIRTLLKYKNPLYDKTILRKILFSKNNYFKYYRDNLILHFRQTNNNQNDSDILRMIGRYYLLLFLFDEAEHFFQLGDQFVSDDNQKCFSLANLSDLVLTKIEKEGEKSYETIEKLRSKLEEVENYLKESIRLFPEFEHYEPLFKRYTLLMNKYN